MGKIYLAAAHAGADSEPLGNAHPSAAPHGVYPPAGDDSWIAIAVMDDEAWHSWASEAPSGHPACRFGRLPARPAWEHRRQDVLTSILGLPQTTWRN